MRPLGGARLPRLRSRGISAYELRRAAPAAADPRVASVDLAEVDATADAPDGRTVRLAALLVLEAAIGAASRGRA